MADQTWEPELFAAPMLITPERSIAFPSRGHIRLWRSSLSEDASRDETPTLRTSGVWLVRAESGVCALMPQQARLLINSQPVHLMIVLCHGDHVDIDGDSARFAEIPRGRPDSEARHLPPCLYCGAAHEADHLVYQCPLCHAVYHDDCWARLFDKRCCSRACPFVPEAEA